jgi:integrase
MKSRIPAYPSVPHKSGQARIWLNGRDVYLGKFGSRESKVKYGRLIADFAAHSSLEQVLAPAKAAGEILICELVQAFWIHAQTRYVKNGKHTSEIYAYRSAAAVMTELFGQIPAQDFGPRKLKTCMTALQHSGKVSRKIINRYANRIRRIFQWGVAEELISETTWKALQAVEGLTEQDVGKSDPDPIGCIGWDKVEPLRDFVLPPIWAMIQIQTLTGMRPGEVVQLRTCDITADDPLIPKDQRGKLRLFSPKSHKTQHHDLSRLIFIGPRAQGILAAWMRPTELDAYLFSPDEAVKAYRLAQVTTGRGSRKRKHRRRRGPQNRYTTETYRRAIVRGCEFAFEMPDELRVIDPKLPKEEQQGLRDQATAWRAANCWHPNQLRHNAGTTILEEFEIDTARAVLGHTHASTTETYAPRDLKKAAIAAAAIG